MLLFSDVGERGCKSVHPRTAGHCRLLGSRGRVWAPPGDPTLDGRARKRDKLEVLGENLVPSLLWLCILGLWPLPPSSESAMLHCNPAPIVSLSPALTYLPASSSFCTEGPWDSTGPSLIT